MPERKEVAHELGHGIFGLQHPYDQYAGQREGTTDLLMDTGRGERLSPPDWPTIHAPGLQFYAFQKDEQGESAAVVDCGTGFCCTVCGKDLTLTTDDLKRIYGPKAPSDYVGHLNTALKKGGFNTCTSNAHFFSQSKGEVGGDFSLVENPNYRLHAILGNHHMKESIRHFYNQSFWDDETYLDYFQFFVFKKAPENYQGTRYKGEKEKTFIWGEDNKKSITVPTKFSHNKNGKYQKVEFNDNERKARNKKLFSYLYANNIENGDPSTGDGWKFRGRGLIHLTWRGNYRSASEASELKLDYNVDWETNYKRVSGNAQDAVYSAVAYFLFRLPGDKFNHLHDASKVSYVSEWVNGARPANFKVREKHFNQLIRGLFKCNKE